MNKLLFIFALFFSHFFNVNAQKDKLDQLFTKYQESEGVTSIKITKPMFSMLNKLNIDDAELSQIKPLLAKINGLKILIVEKPESVKNAKDSIQKFGMFQSLQNDISSSIKKMNYEELITVNSKDNKIKFLSSDATNGNLENLLLSINSEGNTLLMMLDGKLSMDDVNRLVQEAEKSSPKTFSKNENITFSGSSQVRNVDAFSGIEVSSGIKVNFTQDKNQSVVVETDPGMEQYVSTIVQNGTLKISVKNQGKQNLRFKKLFVNVKAPHLKSIKTTSGASLTTLNEINEDSFNINAESGSNINAELNGDKITANVESGGTVKLAIQTKNFTFAGSSGSSSSITGTVDAATFQISSAASCNAQNLVAKNVTANASSAGSLKVHAKQSLNSVTSSSGSVRYNGKPESFNASNSSGGTTKPIN
ncbi:DUF4252 domain-containing protein [Chryseobacterium suipulveris]|uniref:DUF4252 domain-containing protein n=1 Tax=Chryseobacterium suipulveris TaxID=2929800 RepID=A0ABY4BR04_9FLAO|nr:DUF4252 domain-containing protein [Chryseobacterium suipulveris]UOE41633.1 DUF4252 domain-containing protein [Chryseobacterium suipulveris]